MNTDEVNYHVYILRSINTEEFYVGMSSDLKRRLEDHNRGKVRSTRRNKPWKIIYAERFKTRLEARMKEKYLKSAAGRRFRKQLWGLSSVG